MQVICVINHHQDQFPLRYMCRFQQIGMQLVKNDEMIEIVKTLLIPSTKVRRTMTAYLCYTYVLCPNLNNIKRVTGMVNVLDFIMIILA